MHVQKEIEDRSKSGRQVDLCSLLENVEITDGISPRVAIETWFEDRFGEPLATGTEPQRYFSPTVQDTFFSLTGTGSPGGECGDDVMYWCKDCKRWFKGLHHCGERQCPHCSHIWVRDLAGRMKGRLWDGRERYRENKYRIHHVVVSYDMDVPDNRGWYGALRKATIQLLREAGAEGGCLIFHPWRESKDGQYDISGPHFHAFILSKWVKPADELLFGYANVVFKRIGNFDARQIEPFEYVLTHCGIAEGCHAIVWFGNLAYNKMEKGPQELRALQKTEPEPEICPHCGSNNTTYVDMREIYGFIQRHPASENIPPKEM